MCVDGCWSRHLWDSMVGADHEVVFAGGNLQQFLDKYNEAQNALREHRINYKR